MNLILLRQNELSEDSSTATLKPDDERTRHILGRLNKKTGDTVSIGVIGGTKGKASVQVIDDQNNILDNHHNHKNSNSNNNSNNKLGLKLKLIPETMETPSQNNNNEPEITLILAVPFPVRLKYLWPTIASFAYVTRIVIIRGQLSDLEFCKTKALQSKVYEDLIERGMSQGGRTRPVQVDICLEEDTSDHEVVSRDLLSRLGLVDDKNDSDNKDNDDDNNAKSGEECHNGRIARIFLDCGDEHVVPPPARDIVLKYCQKKQIKTNDNNSNDDTPNNDASTTNNTTAGKNTAPRAIIAVGPERGWTEEEASIFVKECGFESATLGSSILRVDTAVIAGLGIVSAALDECQNNNNDGNEDGEEDSVSGSSSKRQRCV